MERRIVIRHSGGTKGNQVEGFPIKHVKEVTFGRDPSCEVKWDADREDLVSRRHAKLGVEREDPLEVTISDLGSRDGTFVNKQRVFSPVHLNPGDTVQLGAGGPEFRFDVDPPTVVARPTRLASEPMAVMPPTREALASTVASSVPATSASSGTVGRANGRAHDRRHEKQNPDADLCSCRGPSCRRGGACSLSGVRPKTHNCRHKPARRCGRSDA